MKKWFSIRFFRSFVLPFFRSCRLFVCLFHLPLENISLTWWHALNVSSYFHSKLTFFCSQKFWDLSFLKPSTAYILIMILWYIHSGFMFVVHINGFIRYNESSKIEIKISGLFLEKKEWQTLLWYILIHFSFILEPTSSV